MDLIRARAKAAQDAQDAANGEQGIAGPRLDAIKRMKQRRGGH